VTALGGLQVRRLGAAILVLTLVGLSPSLAFADTGMTPSTMTGMYSVINTEVNATSSSDPSVTWGTNGQPGTQHNGTLLISDGPEAMATPANAYLAAIMAKDESGTFASYTGEGRIEDVHNNNSSYTLDFGFCFENMGSSPTTLTIMEKSNSVGGAGAQSDGESMLQSWYDGTWTAGQTYSLDALGGANDSTCFETIAEGPNNYVTQLWDFTNKTSTGTPEPLGVFTWFTRAGQPTPTFSGLTQVSPPDANNSQTRTTVQNDEGMVSTVTYNFQNTCASGVVCGIAADLDSNEAQNTLTHPSYPGNEPNPAAGCSPSSTGDYLPLCYQTTSAFIQPNNTENWAAGSPYSTSCSAGNPPTNAWCAAADPLGWTETGSGGTVSEYQAGTDQTDKCTTAGFYCALSVNGTTYYVREWNYGEYGSELTFYFTAGSSSYPYTLALAPVYADSTYGWLNALYDHANNTTYYTATAPSSQNQQLNIQTDQTGTVAVTTSAVPFGINPIRFVAIENGY
jgi:hypothetical protein